MISNFHEDILFNVHIYSFQLYCCGFSSDLDNGYVSLRRYYYFDNCYEYVRNNVVFVRWIKLKRFKPNFEPTEKDIRCLWDLKYLSFLEGEIKVCIPNDNNNLTHFLQLNKKKARMQSFNSLMANFCQDIHK